MKFFSFNLCYFNHLKSLNVSGMKKSFIILCVILFAESLCCNVYAQLQFGEPTVKEVKKPKNLYDEGYKRGFGFAFGLTDFGFGIGMQYRIGLSSYTEGLINFKIAGLRDPNELTYIDFYFGNRTVASKYRRVITFPTTLGIKRRLFASQISDNFRVHTSINIGPSFALTIPYFRDYNDNGYREDDYFEYNANEIEPINDIFQGWDEAESKFGWNGEFMLGIDFGDKFKRLQTLQFGYTWYYFNQGLQILEPKAPNFDNYGNITGFSDANDKVYFIGSAQITFIVGWMYN